MIDVKDDIIFINHCVSNNSLQNNHIQYVLDTNKLLVIKNFEYFSSDDAVKRIINLS